MKHNHLESYHPFCPFHFQGRETISSTSIKKQAQKFHIYLPPSFIPQFFVSPFLFQWSLVQSLSPVAILLTPIVIILKTSFNVLNLPDTILIHCLTTVSVCCVLDQNAKSQNHFNKIICFFWTVLG